MGIEVKYQKEIVAWMGGEAVQWRSKFYHNKWEDLPKFSDTVESFTVGKNGLLFVECGKFSIDFANDNSIEFRIKPDPKILYYRNAVVKTIYGIEVRAINYPDLINAKTIYFHSGEEFVGWVDEIKEIDVNLFE